ncbi:MAG: hypothetical protein RL380_1667, partial [Verrucomicrobiota bacterium]
MAIRRSSVRHDCLSQLGQPERQPWANDYFFLAADLAATAALFLFLALLTLAFFCVDFFWLDFGDLSPMVLIFFCGLTRRRHEKFLRRQSYRAGARADCKWRRQIVRVEITAATASSSASLAAAA